MNQMKVKPYVIDSNVIIYSLLKEYIDFSLTESSISVIEKYEDLKAEEKIVPFFIATETISLITKRFYGILKKNLTGEDLNHFEVLLKTFIKSFENNHTVFNPAEFLLKDCFRAFRSVDYLKTPNLTFTDVSLALTSHKTGLNLLTCDKNLMKFYQSLN
jgi:predicted nucleic acid-binding protein